MRWIFQKFETMLGRRRVKKGIDWIRSGSIIGSEREACDGKEKLYPYETYMMKIGIKSSNENKMNGTKWMVWMENIIYRKNRKCEQSLSSGVEERRLLEDVAVRRVENQEDQKIVFVLHFFFGFCLLKKSHFFLSHPQKWRREYKRRKEGRKEKRNSYMSSVSLYNFYWSYFSRSFFPNNFFSPFLFNFSLTFSVNSLLAFTV